MGRQLWKLNGFEAMGRASGTVRKAGKARSQNGFGRCVGGPEQDFESRLETNGWLEDKKSAQRLQVARGNG